MSSDRWQVHQVGRWRYEVVYLPGGDDLWIEMTCGTFWGRRRAIRFATREALWSVRPPAGIVVVTARA